MSTGMPRRLPTFWQLAWTLRRVRGDRHGINQGSGEGVRATQKEIFVYKPRLMPVLMDPISFFVPDRILRRSVRNFVPRGLHWADSRPAKIYCKLADNRPQEDDDLTRIFVACLRDTTVGIANCRPRSGARRKDVSDTNYNKYCFLEGAEGGPLFCATCL